jgi:hypothetical protein
VSSLRKAIAITPEQRIIELEAELARVRVERDGAVADKHIAVGDFGRLRNALEDDSFLDYTIDLLEERNGRPLNLARWDLKAAIRKSLERRAVRLRA